MAALNRFSPCASARSWIVLITLVAGAHCATAQPATHSMGSGAANTSELSLAQAIERALEVSPELRSAEAEVDAAEGHAAQASLRPNPELTFEAENLGGTGPYRGLDGTVYTLAIAQRIEIGGKRKLRSETASKGAALQRHRLLGRRLELIRRVRTAYIRVVAAQEQLALAAEHHTLAQTLLSEVEKRVQAARAPALQLSKAQIALATARLVKSEHARELRHAQHVLGSFWQEVHQSYLYNPAPLFELTPPTDEVVLEQALEMHPMLRYQQLAQRQQSAQLRLEQASALPDPTIGVGLRQFEETGDRAMVIELSMPLPLFDRNQGNVRSAQARQRKGLSDEQTVRLELTAQGLQALEEMINAYERALALSSTIIPAAERAFALAREGYATGRFPYLEVLDAERTLFDSKLDHIAALAVYQEAKAEVAFVMADEAALQPNSLRQMPGSSRRQHQQD